MKAKIMLLAILILCLLIWFGLSYQGYLYHRPRFCTVLRFPASLSFPGHPLALSRAKGIDPLVFRHSAIRTAQILVTAQSAVDIGLKKVTYAAQKYEFDLYRGGPLKPISEDQWQSGTEINSIEDEALPVELKQRNYWGLVVGFDQSGDQSTGKSPVLSLDRKQVALASYTGFYTARILSQLPDHGLWHWDIFDINTHKKRFTIRGLFMDIVVTDAQGGATWLPDSRLVLSLGNERDQQFLLCDLSSSNQ